MFNFIKKIRNKDNTPKKGYNLSYDNLAIPEIHIKGSDDESPDAAAINGNNQDIEGVDKKKTDVSCDGVTQAAKAKEHKKTHVTYDGVAVPEIHFKNKE